DEIFVNAADNKVRDQEMNVIKVDIDKEGGQISVFNYGKGIPIEIHEDFRCRNAKLTNIYSSEFILETSSNGKIYRQTFRNNMKEIVQPIITDHPLYKKEVDFDFKGDYTLVKFKPDFRKFKMSRFDDDIIALIKKRVYDLAGSVENVE
ncbi:5849_t:CDS:2, partial [Funneliformis geosporum]